MARAFPNQKIESAQRRLNRFLKEVRIQPAPMTKLIVAILGIKKSDLMKLVLDRTNWKFGKNHINILFLSVCVKGIATPLFFKFLDGKKSGNSNQQDRWQIINQDGHGIEIRKAFKRNKKGKTEMNHHLGLGRGPSQWDQIPILIFYTNFLAFSDFHSSLIFLS